jgi:type I restriction enzyme, S subunit
MMSKGDRRELDTGEGMSEWQEIRLGDICDIYDGPHATPPKQNSGCIFLGISSLGFDGKIDPSQFEYISEEFYKKWTRRIVPQTDDIVFSYETKLGVAALLPKNFKCCLGRRMGLMRIKSDVIPRFLLYAYLAPDFQKTIYERTIHGSTVDRIPLKDFPDFPISIPPLPEQKAIASILSSLDDKIDLLHRQNRTLEAIAETLFRQWFIEEAQEDWENVSIGQLGRVITGKTPSTQNQEFWGEAIDFITPTDFKNYGKYSGIADRGLSLEGKEIMKNILIPANSILVTCIGSDMGKVAISRRECITNQQINSLIIHSESIYLEYVYQYLKNLYPLLRSIALGGTTMPIINKTDFSSIEIPLPPNEKLEDFNLMTSSFSTKIQYNSTQIRTLEKLRDNLLPKLMSGEMRVDL